MEKCIICNCNKKVFGSISKRNCEIDWENKIQIWRGKIEVSNNSQKKWKETIERMRERKEERMQERKKQTHLNL